MHVAASHPSGEPNGNAHPAGIRSRASDRHWQVACIVLPTTECVRSRIQEQLAARTSVNSTLTDHQTAMVGAEPLIHPRWYVVGKLARRRDSTAPTSWSLPRSIPPRLAAAVCACRTNVHARSSTYQVDCFGVECYKLILQRARTQIWRPQPSSRGDTAYVEPRVDIQNAISVARALCSIFLEQRLSPPEPRPIDGRIAAAHQRCRAVR